jgi:hypothetical protein
MGNSLLIISLAVGTLTIVIAYLVIERIGVAKAKDEHHHSELTKRNPELRDG